MKLDVILCNSTENIVGVYYSLSLKLPKFGRCWPCFTLLVDRNFNSFQLGPERNSVTGSGGIRAGSGFGPVLVDLASAKPVPRFFLQSVFLR